MKKVIVLFVSALVITATSFAQMSKEQVAAQRAKSLLQVSTAAKDAGLDEKQLEKVKATLETLFKKQDEAYADSTLTPDARKEKLKKANEEKDWKLKNTMGDKWDAYVEARKKLVEAEKAKQ
jgi:Skp family chaperone for outer membrane proteins